MIKHRVIENMIAVIDRSLRRMEEQGLGDPVSSDSLAGGTRSSADPTFLSCRAALFDGCGAAEVSE